MKFKPFDYKFEDDRLNKPVRLPAYNNEACDCHDTLDHIEVRDRFIYCKNCGVRLKLIPSWII